VTVEVWLGVAGFVLNVIVLAIAGTWALSRHGRTIENAIHRSRQETDGEIDKLRMELRTEHDDFLRRFGDSLNAIRQKVNEVELWARDEFVRRDDFYRILDGINKSIVALGDKIDARTDRLEGKIEQLRVIP
jgi:N12 class adenine-specific DNA methylase